MSSTQGTLQRADLVLTITLKSYLRGLCHALDLVQVLQSLFQSQEVVLDTLKCIAVNVFMIYGSDVLLRGCLLPVTQDWGQLLYGGDPPASTQWMVEGSSACLFYGLWLWPVWALIYLAVNIPTYAQIAKATTRATLPRKDVDLGGPAAEVYRFLFFFVLLMQKYAVQTIPLVGAYVAFAFSLLLCSLYSFDYAWAASKVPVSRRHHLVENGWPYFAGFGTPTTLLTFFLPVFRSLAVYAAIFPFVIFAAMAHAEDAKHDVAQSSRHVVKVPIFVPTYHFTEKIVDHMRKYLSGQGKLGPASSAPEPEKD